MKIMKKAFGVVFALLMTFSMLNVAALTANPGEGSIPVPNGYNVDSKGKETANPATLSDGQVWVNKNVIDNGDGTFDVTLYAWAKGYTEDEEAKNPLSESNPDITITDTIGLMFDYGMDANNTVGIFGVDSNVATWLIAQEDILDGIQSCTFTVSLKSGWEVEVPYYTNEGASATFYPQRGNPYYWVTEINEEVLLAMDDINWNNGEGTVHGINRIRITDSELGLIMHKSSPSSDNFSVIDSVTSKTLTTFTFDGSRTVSNFTRNADGTITLPSNVYSAKNGTWGVLWDKGGGTEKTYYVWFMGLTEDDVLTVYDVNPGNNGGNNGEGGTRSTFYKEYRHKSGFNWEDDDSVIADLPNRGVVELSYIPALGSLQITKSFFNNDGLLPDDLSFTVTGPDDYSVTIPYSDFTNGSYTIDGLVPGMYSVTENNADMDGYSLTADISDDVMVVANEVATISVINTYTVTSIIDDEGSLQITKSFVNNDGLIPDDLSFTVTGPDDYSVTIPYSDFTNGSYTIDGLVPGMYSVAENNADIEGYSLTADIGDDVMVVANEVVTINVINTYTVTSIIIEDEEPPLVPGPTNKLITIGDETVPTTGDSLQSSLAIFLAISLVVGFVALTFLRKKETIEQ